MVVENERIHIPEIKAARECYCCPATTGLLRGQPMKQHGSYRRCCDKMPGTMSFASSPLKPRGAHIRRGSTKLQTKKRGPLITAYGRNCRRQLCRLDRSCQFSNEGESA